MVRRQRSVRARHRRRVHQKDPRDVALPDRESGRPILSNSDTVWDEVLRRRVTSSAVGGSAQAACGLQDPQDG